MLCTSCKIDIDLSFKYAIDKNICPACGGSIMDEESIALIQDIKETISNEVKLREETTHKVAMLLLSQYNISFRDGKLKNSTKQEKIKIAPPSSIKLASNNKNIIKEEESNNIIKAEEIYVDNVSDEEREKIMEEVVKKRYTMIGQIQMTQDEELESNVDFDSVNHLFSSDDINPVLEEERMKRLIDQQNKLKDKSGKYAVRRS